MKTEKIILNKQSNSNEISEPKVNISNLRANADQELADAIKFMEQKAVEVKVQDVLVNEQNIESDIEDDN